MPIANVFKSKHYMPTNNYFPAKWLGTFNYQLILIDSSQHIKAEVNSKQTVCIFFPIIWFTLPSQACSDKVRILRSRNGLSCLVPDVFKVDAGGGIDEGRPARHRAR